MMTLRATFLALLMASLLPLCANEEQGQEEATPVSELDAAEASPRQPAPSLRHKGRKTRAEDVDSLTFSFFRELAASQPGNVCFSPASLEALLLLLREGAEGDCFALLDALPFGAPDGESARHILTQSALFADESLRLASVAAPLHFVPFADNPALAAERVNTWARRASAQQLQQILPAEGLAADTRLLALSVSYMRQLWLSPFRTEATREEAFHRADGSTAPVPLMQQLGEFRYAETGSWQAVALCYRNKRTPEPTLCFIGILPRGDARDFARKLDMKRYDSIRRALSCATPQRVRVALPRMEADSCLSLRESLSKLGAGKLFAPGINLSRYVQDDSLTLADIVQRCRLCVNEDETAAPAGTDAVAEAYAPAASEPKSIRFDRPFIWAIDDLTTGAAPAFLGLVETP